MATKKVKATKDINGEYHKDIGTLYPSGFSLKYNNSNILVIDYFDEGSNSSRFCVGSFAMDLNFCKSLSKSISEAIDVLEKKK